MTNSMRTGLLAAAVVSLTAGPAAALSPNEVLVVGNAADPDSVALARYYAAKRGIPATNVVLIETTGPGQTLVTRAHFDGVLREAVRKALATPAGRQVRCLSLMYGVPYRVQAPADGPPAGARGRSASPLRRADASVDSELALALRGDYPLAGPAANPLYWRARADAGRGRPLMVARIDGPSKADALRIIKASLDAEAQGLEGVFYVDAGGPARISAPGREHLDGRLKALHRLVSANTSLKVVLDTKPVVFPADSCPRTALYVGWYSPQKYVPAFMWTPGAVGYHVASAEAAELRQPASQEWCPQMIQNGVAATIGAVQEPLLSHFPDPEHFYALLLTGKYTVAECYWRTIPSASWQMLLLADPLYNPFKARPALKASALPAGLAPQKD